MGDPKGFLTLRRAGPRREAVDHRLGHFREFYEPMPDADVGAQGARCMDCGVPFCQGDTGCPVHNLIPEWNELVFRGRWREASDILHSTNNFPEFTGRLCPAPCESACVLGLIDDAVSIRAIEQRIVDRAFDEGWIAPQPPLRESGRRVAIVGSGPAGLAAAQQLRRAGHMVTVFERADRAGGLLRYGIPDFKLEKPLLDRRLAQLTAEGVHFRCGVSVGVDVSAEQLRADFDAVFLATGAPTPRDLPIEGRSLDGIHFAMDFLDDANRRVAGDRVSSRTPTAEGRRVVIIGGGDTASDCAGVALRQGATSVTQLELMAAPPAERSPLTPWPNWPLLYRTSHAHEEGASREWRVMTEAFEGNAGAVQRIRAIRSSDDPSLHEAISIEADLVLLAMGFTGGDDSLAQDFGVEIDARGNVVAPNHVTRAAGVFAGGDRRRGASLIVWAIREGRDAARTIERYLAVAPAYRLTQ